MAATAHSPENTVNRTVAWYLMLHKTCKIFDFRSWRLWVLTQDIRRGSIIIKFINPLIVERNIYLQINVLFLQLIRQRKMFFICVKLFRTHRNNRLQTWFVNIRHVRDSWAQHMSRIRRCLTSRGYLTPSRLCSDPSDEALQRPQWKVMRPTLNFDLRPPPLT